MWNEHLTTGSSAMGFSWGGGGLSSSSSLSSAAPRIGTSVGLAELDDLRMVSRESLESLRTESTSEFVEFEYHVEADLTLFGLTDPLWPCLQIG